MNEFTNFAEKLAMEGGKIIKKNFSLNMAREWKSDKSPLTYTDTLVNGLLVDSITRHYPEHGILAEEGGSITKNCEYLWICDPVDGTIPFSYGIPTFTLCLSLVKNGKPIMGVIYDPIIDRIFTAEKGQGAYLNGKIIHVSSRENIIDSDDRCMISLYRELYHKFDLGPLMNQLVDMGVFLVAIPSAAYMGALVACGELTASIFPVTMPWETAALKVITEEAGGRVTNLWGEEGSYTGEIRGHIVSNGLVHEELCELSRKLVTYN